VRGAESEKRDHVAKVYKSGHRDADIHRDTHPAQDAEKNKVKDEETGFDEPDTYAVDALENQGKLKKKKKKKLVHTHFFSRTIQRENDGINNIQ